MVSRDVAPGVHRVEDCHTNRYLVEGDAHFDPVGLASLDALAATGARTVPTGHGEPWTGGAEAIVAAAREQPVA